MEKPDSRSAVPPPSPPLSLTFEASIYRGIRSRLMPLALDAIWEQSTERHAANQTGRVLAGLTSDLPAHHSPPLAHAAISLSSIVSSPTLSTLNSPPGFGQPAIELTSLPERHPFRLSNVRTLSTIRVDDLYVQRGRRTASCIARHPAPHYAPLLLIESIVFRLAVALTGTAKSAKSRGAMRVVHEPDVSLGIVDLWSRHGESGAG